MSRPCPTAEPAVCRHPGGLDLTARAAGLLGLSHGAAVLDVGCGEGATGRYLAQAHGSWVTGVDVSEEALAIAKGLHPAVQALRGRAEQLPCEGGAFEAVFCECTLSLVDAAAALDEIHRVLAPDGRLALSDLYVRGGGGVRRTPPPPLVLGTQADIERLLDRHGFTVELFEDHTGSLAQFVWEQATRTGSTRPPSARGPAAAARPAAGSGLAAGYFLCIARRRSGDPVQTGVVRTTARPHTETRRAGGDHGRS